MSDCGLRLLHEARTSGLVPGDLFKQPRLPDEWGSTPASAVINPRPGAPQWGGGKGSGGVHARTFDTARAHLSNHGHPASTCNAHRSDTRETPQ